MSRIFCFIINVLGILLKNGMVLLYNFYKIKRVVKL